MDESIIIPRRAPRMTRVEIAEAARRQDEVISALRSAAGRNDVADRLEHCMAARLARRGDPAAAQTWGYRCRSAGCCWCGRTAQGRAYRAALRWGRGLVQRSLVVIPLPHPPGGLRSAVKAVRRALRDARDTESSKSRRWLDVGFGGVVVGDAAWLVVLHPRLDRQEIERVLRRRWPAARVSADLPARVPFSFTTSDLAELALARRGGEEPFKVIVGLRQVGFDQHHQEDEIRSVVGQPMPFVF